MTPESVTATDPAFAAEGRRVVVHVLNVLDRGGLEVRTLEVIRGLDPRTVRVIVCTLAGRRGELASAYEAAGAEVVPLDMRSPGFARRFLRLLRAERVDVVHSHIHFSSGPVLTLARVAGVRIRIAHFRSDSHGRERSGPAREAYYAIARVLILAFATTVVGVSPSSLQSNWGRVVDRDPRFQVLPNGIDTSHLRPPAETRLSAELGLSPDGLLAVHVGRADIATKNRSLAVQVLSRGREEGLAMKLAFVGRHGSDQASMMRQAGLVSMIEGLGLTDHIAFLGERGDVGSILHQADVLLSTSTLEGLPGAVLEAAACGLPVVSSDVPGAVYIADQLEGIEIVPMTADPPEWVAALRRAAVAGSDEDRAARRNRFSASVFSLPTSLRAYRELWRC